MIGCTPGSGAIVIGWSVGTAADVIAMERVIGGKKITAMGNIISTPNTAVRMTCRTEALAHRTRRNTTIITARTNVALSRIESSGDLLIARSAGPTARVMTISFLGVPARFRHGGCPA